jgi:ribosomal protein S18 acetylase RimI-like enzyme
VASTSIFRIEPLGAEHDRSGFSCGVEALERYLKTQTGQDQRRGAASCFVALDASNVLAGYYTLAMTSVDLADLPDSMAKKLPRYPKIPAALLGRLAIDQRFQRHKLGQRLLYSAMLQIVRSNIACAMFVVDAKDEMAAAFYTKFGFLRLGSCGLKLFMPISEITKLVDDTA